MTDQPEPRMMTRIPSEERTAHILDLLRAELRHEITFKIVEEHIMKLRAALPSPAPLTTENGNGE